MNVLFLLKNTGLHERLGIMQLSAILKPRGHNVELMVCENLAEEEIVDRVKDFDPGVIAHSVMTGEHNYNARLNLMLKEHHDFYSIFGGPHPTYSNAFIQTEGVDSICIGEGDFVMQKVVEGLENGEDFYSTPNFWFKKDDGSIGVTP
jgi:anaerobic magnesium-protoporphyrin IX monomethyl ester cyclase